MKILTRILLVAFCAVALSSCNEDEKEKSDIAVFIEPGASVPVVLGSGDKFRYHLDLYTTHGYVQHLRVTSFDSYQGEVVVKDTTWSSRTDTYDFIYTAPAVGRDSLAVTLTFSAADDAGSMCEVTRKLLIRNKLVLVDEKSGIVMWATETGRPGALMFADPSKTYNIVSAGDSAVADMYIDTDPTLENVRLKTNTQAKFVRNNSFDYAAATAASVQAVYVGSRRDDMVDNLRINDIVLVGHGERAEGVFRVVGIIRTGDADERCVQLAFKGVM